ncbi:MAG: hypothetical protein WC456_03965 [Patescibacteria group bacterium]
MFKIIHHYFRGRWERYYLKSHWHLILDLSLFLIIVILLIAVASLYFYRPSLPGIGAYAPPTVDLNNPPLEIDYALASSTIKIKNGNLVKISFKNNGTAAISDIKINFLTTDANFTVSQLKAVKVDDRLSLSGREAVLAKVPAGESGEVSVWVYFNQKNQQARQINWQAQSQYNMAGQVLKETASLPSLTVAAELKAQAVAYYTSPQGDQLGIGPLPPLVGIPTDYWIFWEASSVADFKNIVFSARLPQGVELAAGRSLLAGEFNYSTSSRQIVWRIPELQGGENNYRLGFEIELIPTVEQEFQVLPLLSDIRYYGEDALTGEATRAYLNELDTNLDGDHFNSGRGVVSQP